MLHSSVCCCGTVTHPADALCLVPPSNLILHIYICVRGRTFDALGRGLDRVPVLLPALCLPLCRLGGCGASSPMRVHSPCRPLAVCYLANARPLRGGVTPAPTAGSPPAPAPAPRLSALTPATSSPVGGTSFLGGGRLESSCSQCCSSDSASCCCACWRAALTAG